MQNLGAFVKSADWKTEKHVPAISAPESVKAGEAFDVEVSVGREIPHPNTPAHHIAWIALHYVPEGSGASIELGRVELGAHAQSATQDEGPARTIPCAKIRVSLSKSGTLHATAYCNIHGLWTSQAAVTVS